jgi:hypothetical protein
VSVAGIVLSEHLQEHPDIHHYTRAVNGSQMRPIGKFPLNLSLRGQEYTGDFHIYHHGKQPGVWGCFLGPVEEHHVAAVSSRDGRDVIVEFPSVFNGWVKVIYGRGAIPHFIGR